MEKKTVNIDFTGGVRFLICVFGFWLDSVLGWIGSVSLMVNEIEPKSLVCQKNTSELR